MSRRSCPGDGVKVFMPDDSTAFTIRPGTMNLEEASVHRGDEFEVYAIAPGQRRRPGHPAGRRTILFTTATSTSGGSTRVGCTA